MKDVKKRRLNIAAKSNICTAVKYKIKTPFYIQIELAERYSVVKKSEQRRPSKPLKNNNPPV